jgi:Holliday junction DNA helicase RuvA
MIAFIEGEIVKKDAKEIVVQSGQIGWKIFVSRETLKQLPETGKSATLWTSLNLRQDGIAELYGFLNDTDLAFFELLNSVATVGPKSALAILGLAPIETLKAAIASGNAELLTKVSGVGPKTAQRVVMELKSKIKSVGEIPWQTLEADTDVIKALIKLGYSKDEARRALEKVSRETTLLEDRLKEALKNL